MGNGVPCVKDLWIAYRVKHPSRAFDLSPQRLQHIRWIGGGSGGGKSTVARLLAEKHGFRLYHCDDAQSPPTAPANAIHPPLLPPSPAITMDQRRVKRPPEDI